MGGAEAFEVEGEIGLVCRESFREADNLCLGGCQVAAVVVVEVH